MIGTKNNLGVPYEVVLNLEEKSEKCEKCSPIVKSQKMDLKGKIDLEKPTLIYKYPDDKNLY